MSDISTTQGNETEYHEGHQWYTIDDFSAGIWSNDKIPGNTNVPAPKGAASPTNTYQCIVTPTGALAPGPGLSSVIAYTGSALSASTQYSIFGLKIRPTLGFSSFSNFVFDELVTIFNKVGGASELCTIQSYYAAAPTPWHTIYLNTAALVGLGTPVMASFANTLVLDASNNPQLVTAICFYDQPSGTTRIALYPDPAAPTTFGIKSIATPAGGNASSRLLGYQSRIVYAAAVNFASPLQSEGYSTIVDEGIYFTDPPLSETVTPTPSYFVPEAMSGTGGWGSISVGELFVVKRDGGAYVITGDLFFPSITYLPGVTSTGGIGGNAASTPLGFVYCAYQQGCWVWNGGNTSQKLSSQLDDNFFFTSSDFFMGSYYVDSVGSYILVSNNWLYDIESSSWWRFFNPATQLFTTYTIGSDNNTFYGAPLFFTTPASGSANVVWQFQRSNPATFFSWQSQPIPLDDSPSRSADIRHVVVEAQGIGTITISLTGGVPENAPTSTTVSLTQSINSSTRTRFRLAIGLQAVQSLTIQIQSQGTGGNPAPVIFDISCAYRLRRMVNAA